jgi:hypothetical protein
MNTEPQSRLLYWTITVSVISSALTLLMSLATKDATLAQWNAALGWFVAWMLIPERKEETKP